MRTASGSRRAALRSVCGHCLALAGWFAAGSSGAELPVPAQAPSGTDPPADPLTMQRLVRPALESDEGGLWALMDREETRLRRSPFLVRDPALQEYLRGIVCRLADTHCTDVRVYGVRTPIFNASMAPNGMMQVWTGLLLRMENEAQLAAVLGHELGHYLERHSVEQLRDARSRAAFAQFLGLFGTVGALGQLGMLAGAFAYSREHESRADRLGVRLMQRAGYDSQQAAVVWDNLLLELKVRGGEDVGRRSPMMATHPPVESRRDELLRLAGGGSGQSGERAFRNAIAPHLLTWLQDEVRRGQFDESLALMDRLVRQSPRDPALLYARGEVRRLRAGADDAVMAIKDLQAAAPLEGAPTIVHRSLGLLYRQQGDLPAAVAAFARYLELSADAPDAGLIRQTIQEISP